MKESLYCLRLGGAGRILPMLFLLLTILFSTNANAQDQKGETVSGTITDLNGDPLPGVNVMLKGTSVGAVTDFDGNYKIIVPQGHENGVLEFSFVGYTTESVSIGSKSNINIELFEDIQSLGEIVVVGYGTQKKRDLTGSIASIDQKDLQSLPVPSISDAMQGRAAGVQVISSGNPGDDATLRVRGTGSINNSDPLLVIDGVPVMSGLNQLNPNDIESIQVLKDASATAIYGARGANGVVIVTTKRGAGTQSGLSFYFYTGVQKASKLPEMLNASEFAALHNEMMENNGRPLNPDYSDPASLGEGTDWLGELFRPAPIQNYSLSYSNNTDKSNLYVSGNIFNQEGIIIGTGFKRYSLQLNTDTKLFDRLKIGNNLTLNHDIKSRGDWNIRNAMAALPTQPVLDGDGMYAGPTGQPMWEGDIINPIGKAKLVERTTKGYNLIGSVYAELEIIPDLKFKTTGGMQANLWDNRTWSPKYDWKPTPDPNSYLSQSSNRSFTWLWDNTLTYDKYFNDDHHLTVLAGTSAQANRREWMSASISQFASDHVQQLSNGNLLPTVDGNASDWSILSFMARANYSLKDKYLLTATVRRDGSSRFGSGNKWGTFPSASAAWRVSQEDFLRGVKVISDLKIRAGYGHTGNQEIGNYSFASSLETHQYNLNGNLVSAVVPHRMPNPFVQWEATEQSNIGFDASFFSDRINLTVDAYIRNTNRMLVPMSVPVSTGYNIADVPDVNAGSMRNKGVEMNLSTLNIKGDFNWRSDFNISYNQNTILTLADAEYMTVGGVGFNYNLARQQPGQAVNEFYGYVTNGIFQTEEDVEAYSSQLRGSDPNNRTSPGDIRFADLNNDGNIDDEDRAFIGNPNPRFFFGVNNAISYKGFDLSIFAQGVTGNHIYNANRIWSEAMAVAQNQTTATLDRWNGPGTSNSMPRAVFNDPNKNTRNSDRYVEDGSYLRIKNVTLGYTVPGVLAKRAKLSSARIYASAQNLYTFTNYTGLDPEVPVNGIDFNVYPVPRTISIGVNLGF